MTCQEITEKIKQIKEDANRINLALEKKASVAEALAAKQRIETLILELEPCTSVTPEQAKKILGKDFLGRAAISQVFGSEALPQAIPPIPFTKKELQRAQELGQFLILRTDQIPADKLALPHTKKTLEKAPVTRWALVSKDFIPDSTSKNYLEQTEQMITYLQEQVFAGRVPPEYQEAITEFESQKEALRPLAESADEAKWKPAAEKLANLKITKLTRSSRDEALYDLEVYHQVNNQYLLPDKYTWTSSRHSSGHLVSVGLFAADGADVDTLGPGLRSDYLGVSLSRSL